MVQVLNKKANSESLLLNSRSYVCPKPAAARIHSRIIFSLTYAGEKIKARGRAYYPIAKCMATGAMTSFPFSVISDL